MAELTSLYVQECGSHIYYEAKDATTLDIYTGTLDQPQNVCPSKHLFCENGIIPIDETVTKHEGWGQKD